MKYHIWTIGCQMNVVDSQRVASSLETLGYQPTTRAEEADVIVLNTCVVRQSAEDRAYGRLQSLRPLKTARPEVVINLMGCLVGVKGNPELAETFPYVDVFSPPADPEPLIDYLLNSDSRELEQSTTEIRHALMNGETRLPKHELGQLISAFVPVVEGCSHGCTFCVIPYRRGTERSRPMEEIISEVTQLGDQGIREVTLLGQIVDRYGKDLEDGSTLASLLKEIHQIETIKRIRFLTSHPNWMTNELLEMVADLAKVCEHIEIPVQAGDDQILKDMKRGYSIVDYHQLIRRIREVLPKGSIATDVIVGFPGETEAQFQRTYQLMEEIRFDVVHLARYSVRPGTVAARRMTDDISAGEKRRRFRALEDLQERIASEINASLKGQTLEILVEEKVRGRWKGRTRTNKLVFFESGENLRGHLIPVEINATGPWSMRGVVKSQTPAFSWVTPPI